ncbi:Cobalamin biosynthesis protein CobD [Bosea sp. 62]|uniref:adenosylcobinamide-phosphate synthase CbiB n=1 Tax=unclassified Bosea (in: a-proteobacteria) TaxID=2653178 RepID=UPI00125920BD|nr:MULTISPECIES: adenosylcobinamide-phosphate synthase CbiB [unclassified Bosea (in: a-proteobacteria)]CAD5288561.1 Cobalamin biosynthesis protein CobD [Bosea sp. 21B]CAD5290865.1 Cobalamin biosynthesis protein CobD [Bosea sp. 46]CAD5300820.1 Cobalamin biosynthesis protein CobD [Bosea sp. 7B]VVT60338.1 Cobalamin biosynthesis protein CobD [Bosea sp. EC-HK365B]VXA96288.1 Cobalamin biosynthesis protein CobD [Bosea sp. 62]
MSLSTSLPLLLAALLIEAAIGYPARLFAWIGHPVTWIGALIGWLDRHLNRETMSFAMRRVAGVVALVILLGVALVVSFVLAALCRLAGPLALLPLALLASSLLAQRSLHEHVARVAEGLEQGGLIGGRKAVSMIVGRDPESLDEAGVARAAIESLSENFSDGIVAPAFWLGVGGLPGGVLYKAINTADSMIGHKSPRHLAFGWAAARLDDLVNLPASRLTALLLTVAAALDRQADAGAAWRAVRRDARRHRSPNAGWPEAAMAGALGLRLAGPRVYGAVRVEDGWMGDGRAEATAADIRRALALYRRACLLLWGLAGIGILFALAL